MKPWSIKRKRVVIGIIMMQGFLCIVYTLNFFAEFSSLRFALLGMLIFWYFWLPSVLLIILCYHILTKVYKYEEKKAK